YFALFWWGCRVRVFFLMLRFGGLAAFFYVWLFWLAVSGGFGVGVWVVYFWFGVFNVFGVGLFFFFYVFY
ncbi:hypothetical protein ACQWFT_24810, partial [Salmonella enterica subsp. enterica serovar Infantis]